MSLFSFLFGTKTSAPPAEEPADWETDLPRITSLRDLIKQYCELNNMTDLNVAEVEARFYEMGKDKLYPNEVLPFIDKVFASFYPQCVSCSRRISKKQYDRQYQMCDLCFDDSEPNNLDLLLNGHEIEAKLDRILALVNKERHLSLLEDQESDQELLEAALALDETQKNKRCYLLMSLRKRLEEKLARVVLLLEQDEARE